MVRVRHSSCRRDIWLASFNSRPARRVPRLCKGAYVQEALAGGIFAPSIASEVLKNAKLVYQEHYERWVVCAKRGIGSHMVGLAKKIKEIKVDN